MPAILYCHSNMGRHYILEYLTPRRSRWCAGSGYSINLLRNFKNGKIEN